MKTVIWTRPTICISLHGTRHNYGIPATMAKSEDKERAAMAAAGEFSEEEFKKRLRKIGRLRKPMEKVPTPPGEFTPVEVHGEPISDAVVEDRR